MNGILKILSNQLLVDEKHQILLCVPAKTGATSIKTLLSMHSDKYKAMLENTSVIHRKIKHPHSREIMKEYGLRRLKTYPFENITHIIDTFYKVIFVRHPLMRLYSMFRDKFVSNTGSDSDNCTKFQRDTGKWILKRIRNETSLDPCKTVIQFEEYVKFLSLTPVMFDKEPHVAPITKLCLPCLIKYDFIGKLETSDIDQMHLIHRKLQTASSGYAKPLHLNQNKEDTREKNTLELMKYTNVYDNVDETTFRRLMLTYKLDHKLFGYKSERNNSATKMSCTNCC